jgi:rhodanese-related sulfurtransferase
VHWGGPIVFSIVHGSRIHFLNRFVIFIENARLVLHILTIIPIAILAMKFGTAPASTLLASLLMFWTGRTTWAQEELTSEMFKMMIDAGAFAAIIDVRTLAEFRDDGHIANATLVENLALFGTSSGQIGTPSDLAGCEQCDLAIYCRSGGRAAAAIQHLLNAGFVGRLYNGMGVSQWTAAGYLLVTGSDVSTPAACATTDAGAEQCQRDYEALTSSTLTTTTTNGTITTTIIDGVTNATTTTPAPMMMTVTMPTTGMVPSASSPMMGAPFVVIIISCCCTAIVAGIAACVYCCVKRSSSAPLPAGVPGAYQTNNPALQQQAEQAIQVLPGTLTSVPAATTNTIPAETGLAISAYQPVYQPGYQPQQQYQPQQYTPPQQQQQQQADIPFAEALSVHPPSMMTTTQKY